MTRAIRFTPDHLDHVLVDFSLDTQDFSPTLVGLIINESYTGCAIVLHSKEALVENQKLKIQVGRLEPLEAKIIWVKLLEDSIYKVGIQYVK